MLNYKNNNTDMINPINKVVNKLGIDKVLHFLCGAVIAFVFNIIIIVQKAAMTTAEYFITTIIGVIAAIVIGLVKEFIDTKFDIKDFLVTAFGGVFAYMIFVLAILIQILFK